MDMTKAEYLIVSIINIISMGTGAYIMYKIIDSLKRRSND